MSVVLSNMQMVFVQYVIVRKATILILIIINQFLTWLKEQVSFTKFTEV